MRLPTSGSGTPSQEGERRSLNSELWHACAGPLVCIPVVGSHVVYFPQGHSEQVSASTNTEVDGLIPSYPNLPPQLFCQLHNVTLHADIETDEVYAQMTLQPVSGEKEPFLVSDLGTQSRQPNNFFCKTLTASDTSTHGGFSIPRRAAEKVFPPLDFSQQPPAQELIARDLHDNEWKFRHIYRGQPKRHLLTTGWSVFVSAKRLIARDSVLFIRNEKGQLLLGIRRANRPQAFIPSSVLSSDSMHIGILAAAAHALSTSSRFTVFYNPRASPSEFVIPLSKYEKAVYHIRVSVGMRFRMLFETEESSMRRYMGTITGIGDLDPLRWPNSHWRTIKVGWDESTAGDRQKRVSLWEIEPLTTFLLYPPSSNWRLKRPWPQTLGSTSTYGEADIENMKRSFMWMRGQNGERGYQSVTSQGSSWTPMQQKYDPSLLPGQTDVYDTMAAAALQEIQGIDPSKQLLQFHQQQPQSQQACRSQVQQQEPLLLQQQQPQISHAQSFQQPQYPPEQQKQHLFHQRQTQPQFQQPIIQQKPIHPCNPEQQQHLPQQHHQALQLTSTPSSVTQFPTSQSLVSPSLLPLPYPSSTLTHSNLAMGASASCQNTLALQTLLSNMVSDDNILQSSLLPPNHSLLRQQAGIISASGLHQGSNNSPSWFSSVDNLNQLSSSLQSQLNDIIQPAGGTYSLSMADTTMIPSISIPSLPAPSFLRNCWQEQGPVQSDPHNQHLLGASIDTPFAMGNSISNIPRNFSTGIELQSQLLQAQSSIGGTDFPLHSGSVIQIPESLDDLSFLQQVQSMVQVNPPIRTYTKVYKLGSIGRSLDVTRFRNYTELRHELARMFGLEGQLEDPHRSAWHLVFIDKENDVLLVGDGPWEEFVSNVRCIKILSLAEVLQMAEEGLELPPIPEARQTSSSTGDCPARQDSRNPSSAITSTCSLDY